jgi:hypothetical protein
MKIDNPTNGLPLHGILSLLSEEEVVRLSAAGTATRLSDGDQYLDLERIDQGVRLATGAIVPSGRVLPRSGVQASTWRKILRQLASYRLATAQFGAGAEQRLVR